MSQIDDLDKNLNQAHDLISKLKGTVHALAMNKDFANVMEMVRRQEQTIQELRDEVRELRDANRKLRHEHEEWESKWHWELGADFPEPDIFGEFITDIGIEPARIESLSLGDRMALRDAIQPFK